MMPKNSKKGDSQNTQPEVMHASRNHRDQTKKKNARKKIPADVPTQSSEAIETKPKKTTERSRKTAHVRTNTTIRSHRVQTSQRKPNETLK
jgi:hypothetical protein